MAGKIGRTRRNTHRGIAKAPEHPDSLEHARKCAFGLDLHFVHNYPWAQVAAELWPKDEAGEPAADAAPMWNSAESAGAACLRFGRAALAELQETVQIKAMRVFDRAIALLDNAVTAGDPAAATAQFAAIDRLLRLFGKETAAKVEISGPNGQATTGVLVVPMAMNPDDWATKAAEYMAKIRNIGQTTDE